MLHVDMDACFAGRSPANALKVPDICFRMDLLFVFDDHYLLGAMLRCLQKFF